jgi:hypothetical protein
MPRMDLHPRDAVLPDHTIMAGNTFSKNILYWTKPAANYVAARSFSFAHNSIDRNLLWSAGQPIRTGQKKDGRRQLGRLAGHRHGSQFRDRRPAVRRSRPR